MRTRLTYLLGGLVLVLGGGASRSAHCQEVDVQREIIVVMKTAGPDALESLMKVGISPLTSQTRGLAQAAVDVDVGVGESKGLSDAALHKLIQSLPRSGVINKLPPDSESILEVLVDPTRNFRLPPGIVLAPKTPKELFDSTKGQLIEEKINVIKNSNIQLTPQAEASVRNSESALHAYQIALPQRAPG